MKVFRIENPVTNHGMWYDGNGDYNPFILTLTEGKSKDLPMDWHERYGKDGLRWFSGCSDTALMHHWFSRRDAEELFDNGYRLYAFWSSQFVVEEHQTLFTREGIVATEEIPIGAIWNEVYQ